MQETIVCISQPSFTSVNRTVYRKLKQKNWDIQLVAPSQLDFPGGRKNADKVLNEDPPMHFLELESGNPRLQLYKGLLLLLDKLKPGIVYLDNDPVSRMAMQVGTWCKLNNAKFICQSCENLSIKLSSVFQREGIKGIPAALVKNYFRFRTTKLCSHVFVINNDGEKIFRELGYRSVSKTPLGFDDRIFYPDENSRNAIRTEKSLTKTVFSYFGRLVPEKGVHLFLNALAQIKDLGWQLLMDDFEAYATGYTAEIRKQIEVLGLQDKVIYFHASHTEIGKYMNAADVVVLASISTPKWKEQYGRVIPEAMACGRLVVVARSGALPELAGDAGIVFEEGDVEGLVNILRDIIVHPASYTAYHEKASRRAHSLLSVTSQADILDKKFRELLNENPVTNNQ